MTLRAEFALIVFNPESSAPKDARGSLPSYETVREEDIDGSAGARAADGKGLGAYGHAEGTEDRSLEEEAEGRHVSEAAVKVAPRTLRRVARVKSPLSFEMARSEVMTRKL